MQGAWTAEIQGAFGDLLGAVGEDVQWTDADGVLHVNTDGTWPQALFKGPGSLVMSDMQISDDWSMEYREVDFPGIRYDDIVAIRSTSFRFREVMLGDDQVLKTGRLTRLKDSCWK